MSPDFRETHRSQNMNSSEKPRVHSDKILTLEKKGVVMMISEDSIVGGPASGLGGGTLPKGVCGIVKWG